MSRKSRYVVCMTLLACGAAPVCWWFVRTAPATRTLATVPSNAACVAVHSEEAAPRTPGPAGVTSVATAVTAQLGLYEAGLLTIAHDDMIPLAWTNSSIPVGARYELARKSYYSATSLQHRSNSVIVLATVVRDAQDEEMRNRAMWMCGVGHKKLGNLHVAYDYLRTLVERCEQGVGTAVHMAALDALADVCRAMKKYDESIALNQRFIELSTTEEQRMSGRLMMVITELERNPALGYARLREFVHTAPERQCGAYEYALRLYYRLLMNEELGRRLATLPQPKDRHAAEALISALHAQIATKYFTADGRPLPLHLTTQEKR